MYITGYAVPHICSRITGQKVENIEKLFPSLQSFEFGDSSRGDGEIDVLLGADYYWTVVEGSVKRCGDNGLTAINTKLGWILSGPYEKKGNPSSEVSMFTLRMKIEAVFEAEEDRKLSATVEKMWDLETLGIVKEKDEIPMYEDFKKGIKMVGGRYEIPLPFKEGRPFIDDHYELSKKRLVSLKKKLDSDHELLNQYDGIIKEQLKAGVLEEVKTDAMVEQINYLPHRAVIRSEKKTTKVRIVCDCSPEIKGVAV